MVCQKLATIALAAAVFAVTGADAKMPRCKPKTQTTAINLSTTSSIQLADSASTQETSAGPSELSTTSVAITPTASDSSSDSTTSPTTPTPTIDAAATLETTTGIDTTASASGSDDPATPTTQNSAINLTTSETTAVAIPTTPADADCVVDITLFNIEDSVTMGFLTQQEMEQYVSIRQLKLASDGTHPINYGGSCNKAFTNPLQAETGSTTSIHECLGLCNGQAATITVVGGVTAGQTDRLQVCAGAIFESSKISDNCVYMVRPMDWPLGESGLTDSSADTIAYVQPELDG